MIRFYLFAAFALALGYAQFRESGLPEIAGRLEVSVEQAGSGRLVPARVYLFKNDRPFRLSPVEALFPIRVDMFYRERLWQTRRRAATLEVTCNDQSHFLLLDGKGNYDLPAGKYRVEAYRGLFFKPASEEFELRAGQTTSVVLKLAPVKGHEQWLSGDDHIHITRGPEDDDVFLRWLQAEDLSVGNFLQLQRQMDAAVQYAFGPAGEAKAPGYSLRPGHESRSAFYGHVNLLGGREMIRPLSVGSEYANSPEAYPFPTILFRRGRALGATVGYAHFDGSVKHSALLLDLAHRSLDFVEVQQFGVTKSEAWYQVLNAGFQVTGIAGSDFPVGLGRLKAWPRAIPLLGPERTLVKAAPGDSAYEAWAAGVRRGAVVVSNGPLVEFTVNGKGPGTIIPWSGESLQATGSVGVAAYRPIESVEVVLNGQVVASRKGDGKQTELDMPFQLPLRESAWIAARVNCVREESEPAIQAHTNPVYLLREGKPVLVRADREALLRKWEAEAAYYKSPELKFGSEQQRSELLRAVDETLRVLRAGL